ncbi:MAG: hypothetical protein RR795_01160 [Cetobacterium sp.]|uniref:hypothetical protein n=1 Tax=Cetobacterium sp. TaxID=2071632 RepID=UPI002FCA454C
MKKVIILMLMASSLLLAKGSNDILEDRIENELVTRKIIQLSNYKIDYDIDASTNQINIEVEFEGIKEPKVNFDDITSKLLRVSKEIAPEINDIYIVIKYDPMIGEGKVLFSKSYRR